MFDQVLHGGIPVCVNRPVSPSCDLCLETTFTLDPDLKYFWQINQV